MIPGLCRRFAPDSLRSIIVVVLAGTCLLTTSRSSAQTSYYRHIFFDNGPRTSAYFYTSGKAVAPSTVEFQNGKLPLDSKIFLTATRCLFGFSHPKRSPLRLCLN